MIAITTEDANQLVQAILNMPLQNGFYYREIGMFDFGFGNKIGFNQSEIDGKRCVHEYALHVICEYDVVWKNGQRCVKRFNWDTELSAFHAVVSDIVGLVVKRITIDEKIELQKAVVSKAKDKYDAELDKLNMLMQKREESRRKELMNAFMKSSKSYDEIMTFLSEEADK